MRRLGERPTDKELKDMVAEVDQVLMLNNIVKSLEVEVSVLYVVSLPINHQDVMRTAESATCWKLKEILKIFMMTTSTTFRQGALDISR